MSTTEPVLDDEEFAVLAAEQDGDDDLVKKLRKQLKSAGKELKDLRPLKGRVAEIELDSSLSKAFDQEELKGLSPEQRADIARKAGDDMSPDGLRKAAEYFRWVEPRSDPREDELEGHERVERAGTGAGGNAGAKLDADAVASWGMDKQLKFRKQHPDAWESIKRGDAVYGITF